MYKRQYENRKTQLQVLLMKLEFVKNLRRFVGHIIAGGRCLMVRRRLPDRDLDVLVVSPGGVATTALMEYLALFLKINSPHDLDGYKHLPAPPTWFVSSKTRVILLTGTETEIVSSLRRRGFLRIQAIKLGYFLGAVTSGRLQSFLIGKAIRNQYLRWINGAERSRLLVMSYNDIWDRSQDIAKFLEINQELFLKTFPARKTRSAEQ
jgi:hypothetical protein